MPVGGYDRKERESPALLFYSRSTLLRLPPPHLSVSPCQVSFSSVLALPRGELQRAAATCWQPPRTTEPWNLDLTTPPEAPFQCSLSLLCPPSSLLRPVSPPSHSKIFNFFSLTQLNCPTYSSCLSSFPSTPLSQSECIPLSPGCLWLESHIKLPNATNQQRRAPAFLLQGATCCSLEIIICIVPQLPLPENTHADTLGDSTMVRNKQLLKHNAERITKKSPGSRDRHKCRASNYFDWLSHHTLFRKCSSSGTMCILINTSSQMWVCGEGGSK